MELRIKSLHLLNFKGISKLDIEPDGKDFTVYGDNGTGKTSIADCYSWILSGKDTQNRADFGIKTLDISGNELHNLEHQGEVVFEGDGKEIRYRRTYKEVYQRKRGEASDSFTGHTTDFYVNDVPMATERSYLDEVRKYVPEKQMLALSIPGYFSESLHWQERRTWLLDMFGGVSDKEVIGSDVRFEGLPAILGNLDVDQKRKQIAEKRKKLNEELSVIPVRVDEIKRSIEGFVPEPEWRDTRPELNAAKDRLLAEKSAALNGGLVAQRQTEAATLKGQITERENAIRAESRGGYDAKLAERNAKSKELSSAKNQLADLEARHESNLRSIKKLSETRDQLREAYATERAKEFVWNPTASTCSVCGQAIPIDDEAEGKARDSFNVAKSNRLEEIKANGLKAKADQEALESKNEELQKLWDDEDALLKTLEAQLEVLDKEVNSFTTATPDFTKDATWNELTHRHSEILESISSLQASSSETVAEINRKIEELDKEISAAITAKVKVEGYIATQKRIEELEGNQKRYAREHEELEGQLYLIEEFIRAKVKFLTEKINSHFEICEWQLFEDQQNGGLKECCNATYKGVPYGSLNHGSQVNVGLDIINALGKALGHCFPIFIDNAESVTKLLPTQAQQIRFVVSESDKSLRFEATTQLEGALF